LPIVQNLLAQIFTATAPNWTGDLTYTLAKQIRATFSRIGVGQATGAAVQTGSQRHVLSKGFYLPKPTERRKIATMTTAMIFTPDQLANIEGSPTDEVLELAANLLDATSTVLGGAPKDSKTKLENLKRFLGTICAHMSEYSGHIPDLLMKPGPIGVFIDLLSAQWAHDLGLTGPALVTTFALIAARYGLPEMIAKFKG
jgi:hypothetical protein